jgi:hypothetical protein
VSDRPIAFTVGSLAVSIITARQKWLSLLALAFPNLEIHSCSISLSLLLVLQYNFFKQHVHRYRPKVRGCLLQKMHVHMNMPLTFAAHVFVLVCTELRMRVSSCRSWLKQYPTHFPKYKSTLRTSPPFPTCHACSTVRTPHSAKNTQSPQLPLPQLLGPTARVSHAFIHYT